MLDRLSQAGVHTVAYGLDRAIDILERWLLLKRSVQ